MPVYTDAVASKIAKLFGVRPSTLSYNVIGDDVANDAPALQHAIDSLAATGKRNVLQIAGTATAHKLNAQIVIPSNVYLVGDGNLSKFRRGANLGVREALFSITGENCGIIDVEIEGNTTTSTGVDVSTVSDPLANNLTANTSIWIRPGAKNVLLTGLKVVHTGGYAILIDARTGNIEDVQIIDNEFRNCRPHKFGPAADMNYGSWTGGILYENDGVSYGVKGLKINYNRFRRMTGNCVWGHGYAFGSFHQNVEIIGNQFDTFALDAIQPGNSVNVVVSDNKMYRGGYLHSTDSDAPVPLTNPTTYSVALDSTGYVQSFVYANNSITQQNGGGIDLDGCFDGIVEGNTLANALSGDPLYTADSVGSFGPTKGIQTGNSYYAPAGRNISIKNNTIINFNTQAISLKNAKHCSITGNNIYHPSSASGNPILIFNIATPGGSGTAEQRSHDNEISSNRISYSGANWAIAEVENVGAGPYPFAATDVNRVLDNVIMGTGNYGEFLKASSSGSAARMSLPTNDPAATGLSQTILQREGFGATAATKLYKQTGSGTAQLLQISDSAFLNISAAGAAGTGAIATGNRSTLGFDDAIATSVFVTDGFIAMNAATFSAAKANLLDATWVLLRRKPTANSIEISTAVDTTDPLNPVRIWTDLAAGGGTPGGANTQVQYNNSGAFAGSSAFVWNNTSKVLTVTGATGTAGIVAATSFIQAQEGFYTQSTAYNAIQAPSGGVAAKQATIGINGIYLEDTVTGFLQSWQIAGVFNSGVGNHAPYFTPAWIKSSAYNALQIFDCNTTNPITTQTWGGVDLGRITFEELPSAQTGAASKAIIYMRAGRLKAIEGTGAEVDLISAATVAGANTQVQFNNTGAFGASANFTWDNTAKLLTVTGTTGTAGIAVATSYIQSAEGFYSAGTSSTTVNIPNGGVTALSLISVRNDGAAGLSLSRTSATARTWGLGVDSSGGLFVIDNSTGTRLSINTSGLVTVGVTLAITGLGAGVAGVTLASGYMDSANGYYTGSTSYQAVQAPSGGMYARSHHSLVYTDLGQSSGAPTATTGATIRAGNIYWDTAAAGFRYYNGSAWVGFTSGTPGDVNTAVQFNDGGVFGGKASNFSFVKGTNTLTVTGKIYVINDAAGSIACIVQGAASQSANLMEWRNSTGTALAAVDPAGAFYGAAFAARSAISGSSTTEAKFGTTELRFKQAAGDELNSGVISYGVTGVSTSLNIIGKGTSSRSVRIYDDLYIGGAGNVWLDDVGNISIIGVYAANGAGAGLNVTGSSAYNSIQTSGGFSGASINLTSSAYNSVYSAGGIQSAKQLLAGPFTSDPGTSASSPFHAMSNGQCLYIADAYAGNVAGLIARSARGSYSFPSASGFDDQLCSIGGRGHDGSGFTSSATAAIQFYSTEAYSGFSQGGEIRFATTQNSVGAAASNRRVRWSISHDGILRVHNSSGTAVAGFRWSGSALQFSHNLSTWTDEGSGSAGGVTSVNTGGNGITVSPTTGAVFVSLSTTANVILNALQLNSSATNALAIPNGFIAAQGLAASSFASNSIQTNGGISASGAGVFGGQVTCAGVLAGSNGIQGSAFNPLIGGTQYFGRTGSFQDLAGNTWIVRGGIITTA